MPFPRSGTFRSGTFRSGTFRSGTFHSGSFRPGSFRPDAFPPRHFLSRHFLSRRFLSRRFLSRRFPPRHFSAPALFRPGFLFCCGPFVPRVCRPPGGCSSERRRSSGWEIARSLWEGKTLGRKKRGARWERGGPLVREGKAVWSEGTPSGAGRLGRRGGHPVAGGPLRGAFPAKRVPAEPEVEAR